MPDSRQRSVPSLRVIPESCTGCQICRLACSFDHEGIFRPSVARLKVVITRNLLDNALPEIFDDPVVCEQCNPAPCAEACPEDAIFIDEREVVQVDEDKCNGCGLCVSACPNEVMELNPDTGIAYKCDYCGGSPKCAALCPSGAIVFDFDENSP